jgi:uncharacterized RDD family membrane protein YckC
LAVASRTDGSSVGQYLLGLRVTRADGSPAGVSRVAFRGLLPMVALVASAVSPAIAAVVVLVDLAPVVAYRRCLHDLLAGTQVARRP